MQRIALAALLACCACQKYVALDTAPATVGSDVRVSLDPGAGAVTFDHIGSRVRQAEGRILSANDSTLKIGVTDVTRVDGLEDKWRGDTVVFHRSEILGVERKQVSTSRTLLSIGAFIAGTIVAHAGLRGGGKSGNGQPPPGGGS